MRRAKILSGVVWTTLPEKVTLEQKSDAGQGMRPLGVQAECPRQRKRP